MGNEIAMLLLVNGNGTTLREKARTVKFKKLADANRHEHSSCGAPKRGVRAQ